MRVEARRVKHSMPPPRGIQAKPQLPVSFASAGCFTGLPYADRQIQLTRAGRGVPLAHVYALGDLMLIALMYVVVAVLSIIALGTIGAAFDEIDME